MERYDLIVPENFRHGMQQGILMASQISEGIKNDTLHFRTATYEYLPSVGDVMEAFDKAGAVISWHQSFKEAVGLHGDQDGKLVSVLIPMPKEIKEAIIALKGDVFK